MRRAITIIAVVALLAGPTVLAFFQGGYFDLARLAAGVVAWLAFAAAVLVSPRPLPRSAGGRLALGALVLLAGWTAASIAWTPLSAPGTDAFERTLLYVAVLGAAAAALFAPAAKRAAEPALALGAFVVVGYGMLDRLLPGVFHLARSGFAAGRLEQPLTYWNAMGALAAIGAVLCVRVAGDATRPAWMRAAAAAGAVPLAVGVWLSFSRGALAALAVGLLALAALALTRPQLRAIVVAVVTGAGAAAVANALDGVRALDGSKSARESDGVTMLAVLVVLCGLAAGAAWLGARAESRGRWSARAFRLPRWVAIVLALAVAAAGAGVLAVAARDKGHAATGTQAERLRSLESNRYDYWKVAMKYGFEEHPIRGTGVGGFSVIWLQHRAVRERARVAHSLYIETLAELGLVGFVLLVAFLAGVAMSVVRARRLAPGAAAGPTAAIVVWATHSGLDWDWQMPALTLVAIVLMGLLVAMSEAEPTEPLVLAPEAPAMEAQPA